MATTKLVTGALLLALAASAGRQAPAATNDSARGASTLVIRASVPVGLEAHGDARFGIPFLSGGWRVALAWSSARGYVHAAMAITRASSD